MPSTPDPPIRLLLVEDNPADARLLQLILTETEERFHVTHAGQLSDALELLHAETYDAILLDLTLPDSYGMGTLEQVLLAAPRAPILVLTGLNDETLAVEAIRKGAQDYLVKTDVNGFLMVRAIRYARQRKRTEESLKEADRRKDEFLANISHELRTPMNAILGMTELAMEEPLAPVVRDYLETARNSARVLLALLNEILDFSRIEAGKFELRPAPFRLRAVLDEIMKVLAIRAHEKGLELICDLPLDLPDGLIGDPLRVQQVLVNLAGNAIKFTEQGEVVVRVRRRGERPRIAGEEHNAAAGGESSQGQDAVEPKAVGMASWSSLAVPQSPASLAAPYVEPVELEFLVADTGIGISQEDQQRIFAPFAQGDASTTRTHGGTGLGLAIARSLAGMMEGGVRVESQLGQGSRFFFTARFQRHPEFDLPPNWRQSPDSLCGMRVLIADRSVTNGRVLECMLKRWRLSPELVNDGHTALSHVTAAVRSGQRFPLLILESNLPRLDGLALAKAIQDDVDPAARVLLMVTSADRNTHAGRGKRTAVATRLEKPVSQIELFQAILRIMGVAGDTALASPIAPSVPTASQPVSRKLRILLAEDTRANRLLVVRLLGKRGHSVHEAVDGQEALDRAAGEPFDVVLMDLQMPVMDGFQATAAIRALADPDKARVPIIALTAHAMKGDDQRCLAAGMDAYLAKPIDGHVLIDTVERVAQKAQSEAWRK